METTEQRIFWGTFIAGTMIPDPGQAFLLQREGEARLQVNYYPQTEDEFIAVEALPESQQQVSILGRIIDPAMRPWGKLPSIVAERIVTHQEVAQRAYEIHESGEGGSAFENWLLAERQLLGV